MTPEKTAPIVTARRTGLPHFIGLGAQRAATTWLHQCLDEHPQVFMPEKKELFYFSKNYSLGIDWYRDCFAGAASDQIAGEITPTYLHDAPASRIFEALPSAKLFVVLREPVDRALSAYRLFRDMHYQGQTLRQACENSRYLIHHSMYCDRLREYFDVFSRERVKVYLYDDIQSQPDRVIEDLYAYIGVDARFKPERINQVFNHIPSTKLRRLLDGRVGGWLAKRVKNTWLGATVRRRLATSSDSLSPDDKRYCTELKAVFREDVMELQGIIGRDLSSWL